ncbi:hypothetical protein [Salinisphaera shabanensis]|uniref:hypothetical protein n=1 Tax=Salinisphaera shabanensis TaxID=180542 RepID=UPI0002122261|nr:hypothetical protein [Salinisphaera shabanensis]
MATSRSLNKLAWALVFILTILYVLMTCFWEGLVAMNFVAAAFLALGLMNIRGYLAQTTILIPYASINLKKEKSDVYPLFALLVSALMVWVGIDYALYVFFKWSILDFE